MSVQAKFRSGIISSAAVAAVVLGGGLAVEAGVAHADPVTDSSPAPSSAPPSSDVPSTPAATYAPGMSPNEHAGWAIVDPTTGQQTGGVIVCTPEVCGSGWFAGMRVVLQTLQDPVEAAHSSNGVGNVAGYNGGTYNFTTGQWTYPGQGGSTWQIPLAYPGADQGGTVHSPVCIANCPTPEPTDTASADASGAPSATVSDSPNAEPSMDPAGTVSITSRGSGYAVTLTSRRAVTTTTTVVARLHGKVVRVWNVRPNSKAITFILPRHYRGATLTVSQKGKKATTLVLA